MNCFQKFRKTVRCVFEMLKKVIFQKATCSHLRINVHSLLKNNKNDSFAGTYNFIRYSDLLGTVFQLTNTKY